MANTANYAATPRSAGARVNTANTDVTAATGAVAAILNAGANGTRITAVQVKGIVASGTTQAADAVRLFLFDGAAYHALKEVTVPVGGGNVSATVPNFETVVQLGIDIINGWSLRATTHVGGATASYDVTAFGGDY